MEPSAERYLETLNFIINFLHAEGFRSAEQTLLKEIEYRYPQKPSSSGEEVGWEQVPKTSHTSAPPSTAGYDEGDADSAARSKSAVAALDRLDQPSLSKAEQSKQPLISKSRSEPATTSASHPVLAAQQPSSAAQHQHAHRSKPKKHRVSRAKNYAPWGSDLDEYENADDVGYFRKDVPHQQLFSEQELELGSDDGSEPYFMHQPGEMLYGDKSDSLSSDGEADDERDPGVSGTATTTTSIAAPEKEELADVVLDSFAESALHPHRDEIWELGPTDIKFAEPVTTPSKKIEKDEREEETKPVLSRVESLSSSFKDFEMERLDDDQLSSRLSEPEQAAENEVIDFAPPSEYLGVSKEDIELHHKKSPFPAFSITSSLEVRPESEVSTSSDLPPQSGKDLKVKAFATRTDDAKENGGGFVFGSAGGGGGFSFPVTPPSEEPDQRLFTSWPSVRSSCTSEFHANSDDDNAAAADYQDEDYSSKRISRSSSQVLVGASKATAASPDVEIDLSPSASRPTSAPASTQLENKDSLRVPSLELPASAADQAADTNAEGSPSTSEPSSPILIRKQTRPSTASAPAAPTEAAIGEEAGAIKESSEPTAIMSDVVAHMINLSVDDLHDHDHYHEREQAHARASSSSSSEDGGDHAVDLDQLSPRMEDETAAWQGQEAEAAAEVSPDPPGSHLAPRYTVNEQGVLVYEHDEDYISRKYEVFNLRIIHRRHRTGFEETKDFPIRMNDLIAGRYHVVDFLGSAAFSRAVQALDIKTNTLVCLKIIKNNKDYFDQSLDEIKLLKYVNELDPNDEHAVVRLYDYFYYKEHLFLVCELLRANLYEFQKYNKESGDPLYFTNARIQKIAQQVLRSLCFLHSLGLIHSDLKPENILIKSYSRCEVKVIDLGSSCFITDQLSSYVQSRSYRAPEVILGLPYDHKIDIWSLGCILAELSSGCVLFQNDSLATLLARLEGILGPIPDWMVQKGRYSNRFFTRSGHVYERNATTNRYELLMPKRTSLRHRMPDGDEGLLDFITYLLCIDPHKRPTAAEALQHPWLQMEYPSLDSN